MNAIREAASGGDPLDDLLMCLGLGALYVTLGILLTNRVLHSARANAALQLS
jgi:hypothetical protein